MYGKSWGGFNGLQVAARRPCALKTIISTYSTDDRYADDIHYRGGCVLGREMLSWAHIMFLWNARPPHPDSLGPRFFSKSFFAFNMHAIEKSHYYGFVFLVENRAVIHCYLQLALSFIAVTTSFYALHPVLHNLSFSALVVFFLLPAHLMS